MYKTRNLGVTLSELVPVADRFIISGPPGIGKSEITQQVLTSLGYKWYETRLYEQGESAAGFPSVHNDTAIFMRPFWFKELQEGDYDALLLDDFHLVPSEIQKYLYKLLTHNQLHHYKIDKPIKVFLIGNFKVESADSCEVQSPIMSRCSMFMEYEPDIRVWVRYAVESGEFDPRVIAFVQANPELLYTEDPGTTEMFPCPRSYKELSRIVRGTNNPIYARGVIGARAGAIFEEFWSLLNKSLEEVFGSVTPESPMKDKVVASLILAREYVSATIELKRKILDFLIATLPQECQFLFARSAFDSMKFQFIKEMETLAPTLQKNLLEIAQLL